MVGVIKTVFKWALAVIFVILVFTVFAAGFTWQWLNKPVQLSPQQRFLLVERGDSIRRAADKLHSNGVLAAPLVWASYARYFNRAPIKAGEYVFGELESPLGILRRLQRGDVVSYSITFIEGTTYTDFLEVLSNTSKIEHRLQGKGLQEQMSILGVDKAHPEGWFYPDTYQFQAGDTDVSILKRAYQKMTNELMLAWAMRDDGLPYKAPYDVLIMASIIEKETGAAFERQDIAGVFTRRLHKNMRLQTDPTVIYGLGDEYAGNITRAHLKKKTPYNTYTVKGLPPTPIANPGREALRAAVKPSSGDALYFVAKGDGTHEFSATLEAHNKAVTRYQRHKRAKNYRSSPN